MRVKQYERLDEGAGARAAGGRAREPCARSSFSTMPALAEGDGSYGSAGIFGERTVRRHVRLKRGTGAEAELPSKFSTGARRQANAWA